MDGLIEISFLTTRQDDVFCCESDFPLIQFSSLRIIFMYRKIMSSHHPHAGSRQSLRRTLRQEQQQKRTTSCTQYSNQYQERWKTFSCQVKIFTSREPSCHNMADVDVANYITIFLTFYI